MITCEKELDFSWSKNCIISEILIRRGIPAIPDDRSSVQVVAIQTTGATFQINNGLLYVAYVSLSMNDNIKFLENIKQWLSCPWIGC